MLLAPWMALGALVRQKDALARHQALAFDLERSELERQALDARLSLLQAQVAPHFLFNTLANVQALVDTGSPQAPAVLRSLIAYLRAAVPRLHEPATTFGQELELVQAYLELMHMRIPDRLQFALHVDEAALTLRCPPMTLLTLVENAVRHGIDPSEEGGRIDILVQRRDDRCLVRVSDTGAGLRQTGNGLGTGLSALRERLQLVFGGDVQLRVGAQQPRGVCAELDLPARGAT
jgi:LytS/YehU family sensor histidine kinase